MGTNIMDKFFNLGNKATGGDPVKKALFDYMLMGIVLIVLFSFTIVNLYSFFTTWNIRSLLSSFLFGAFTWFDYWAVLAFRQVYQMMIEKSKKPEDKVESYEEMLGGFNKSIREVKK